ncbi:MAG: M43 family zinc metalloprotease [Bacteroidota bacterium]
MNGLPQFLWLLILSCPVLVIAQQLPHCDSHWVPPKKPALPAAGLAKSVICIPVVVHVVWAEQTDRLSEERVLSQITVLNEDFRAQNDDLAIVPGFYTQYIADTEISFALATTDPAGNPHSGIVYQETPHEAIASRFDSFTGRRSICYDATGGSTAWNTERYLNIWVGQFAEGGPDGEAIFPGQVDNGVPAAEDGVYVDTDAFGRAPELTPPLHLGRTTTHEVGHYLNLLHIWGPVFPVNCNSSCCDLAAHDDLVADTAPQVRTYQGICPTGPESSCADPDFPVDMYHNFMGFASDDCLVTFTPGQKERMRAALFTYRAGLITTDCIVNTTTMPAEAELADITYFAGAQSLRIVTAGERVDWQLFNLEGRRLAQFRTEPQLETNRFVGDLPTGVYQLLGRSQQAWQVFRWVKI